MKLSAKLAGSEGKPAEPKALAWAPPGPRSGFARPPTRTTYMELHFCDLCQEAVPLDDMKRGHAFVRGDRVVCRVCNASMGSAAESEAAASAAASNNSSGKASHLARPPKRAELVSPGVAAALAVASIALTLFAVIALLVRLEALSGTWSEDFGASRKKLDALALKEIGTRDYMVAEAGRAAEEVLHDELERIDTMERQLGEIREALLGREGRSGEETAESRAETQATLLTPGDGLERVRQLEDELQFLQARVFELAKGAAIAPSSPAEDAARPLPLPTSVGELVARLQDPDPVERVGALYALANVSDAGVTTHVVPLLEDDDKYIRVLAARTLERSNARSGVQPLLVALEDVDVEVRESAVSALRAITGQQFLYDPRGESAERRTAVVRWRAWWGENWKAFLYGEE